MVDTPNFPPTDGSILVLPGFADFHAVHNPDLPWARFPSREDPTTSESISFAEFANATHRIAHTFRPHREGDHDGEVVGVIIHCDSILYCATIVGLARAGFVPFPMSPRNSPEAICSMLEKTKSHFVISQPALAPLIMKTRTLLNADNYALRAEELPDLYNIFPTLRNASDFVRPYPARPTRPTLDEICVYIHSSGSTGFPKPIPQAHRQVLDWCTSAVIIKGRDHGVRWASMHLPTFHTIGFYMQLYSPLVSGYPTAVFTPQSPRSPIVPNPRNVLDACRVCGVSGIPTVPAFVEAWSQSEDSIKYLASLQVVAFSGGPLSQKNGDRLTAAGVKFFAVYGATEIGAYTDVLDADDSQGPDAPVKTSADWAWFSFCSRVKPRWIPQGDGTYELQLLTCSSHHPAIENLDDVRGYATNDLFEPHPVKKGLWKITGRKDDVLVMGSGEKVVPLPQEGTIKSHYMVQDAMMFGRGKNEPGVIIELRPEHAIDVTDEKAVIKFRNLIWPVIEEANRTAPAFARIFKEMILVADPKRPFARAPKGTFIRKQTLALYDYEIEKLYQTVDDSRDNQGIAPPRSWKADDIEAWLIQHSSAIKDEPIQPSVDLFDQGFDSLYTTFLRNRIIGALRVADDEGVRKAHTQIPQTFIFDHPTIRQLSAALASIIDPSAKVEEHTDHIQEIHDMIAKYTSDLPSYPTPEVVVFLTGTTGNVGSHALAALLAEPKVTKVYTFNRAVVNGGHDRQRAAFASRGLPAELLKSPKLVPLVGDLGQEFFGLDEDVYADVKRTVTHVIHNAWKVDFNHTLPSFESHIANTRKLIDELFGFERKPRLMFTSSIAAVQGWDVLKGPIPEEPLADATLALGNGYGASKHVTEQLLLKASQQGLQTTTLRVGQVCGGKTTGAWHPTEWVPILVKSSMAIGAFPHLDGSVSWIPMDALASVVVDLVLSDAKLPLALNVVHPSRAKWQDVFNGVNAAAGVNLPFIPYKRWLARLEEFATQENSQELLEKIPGIKIISFYRGLGTFLERAAGVPEENVEAGGMAAYSTTQLRQFSPSVRDLAPINEEYARKWVGYWQKVGFIP